MKDIAIYGAGGFGRELYHLILMINENENIWNFKGFFDDGLTKGDKCKYGTILGGIDELNGWSRPLNVAFAIGNPKTIETLTQKVTNPLIKFPNIIANDCISYGPIEEKLGIGNIIGLKCIISSDVKVGNFNMFNGFITLGHDAKMGNYNVIMPGTRLSGDIEIGNSNLFGANSFIYQGVKIGDAINLAPCSSLFRKPKNGQSYVGNPATILKF